VRAPLGLRNASDDFGGDRPRSGSLVVLGNATLGSTSQLSTFASSIPSACMRVTTVPPDVIRPASIRLWTSEVRINREKD
jgi:hypothetical protein